MGKKMILCVLFTAVLGLFLVGCSDDNINITHLSTKEDLLLLKNGGNFILDNDIDCQGLAFVSIDGFNGKIDGNYHKIYNVKFISDNNGFGLIGNAEEIEIKNLGIENFTIDTDLASSNEQIYVGGLVGRIKVSGKITNSYAAGEIKVDINNTTTYIGGLVGLSYKGSNITNSYSDVEIKANVNNLSFSSGKLYAGGIMGRAMGVGAGNGGYYNTDFYHCLNLGSIVVDTSSNVSLGYNSYVGGIAGFIDTSSTVKYCLSAPKVLSLSTFFNNNSNFGGIVGSMKYYSIYSTYNYYSNYFDDTLTIEEQILKCSKYQGKLNSLGTGVKLYRYQVLLENFMKGDYTFNDLDNNVKDSFLEFDENIWNYGTMLDGTFSQPSFKKF